MFCGFIVGGFNMRHGILCIHARWALFALAIALIIGSFVAAPINGEPSQGATVLQTGPEISGLGLSSTSGSGNDGTAAGEGTRAYILSVSEPLPCPIELTHYWMLDENPGPPYADAVGGNDATCTNCPAPVAGTVGGAQHFDGLDDEIWAPNDGTWDWDKDASFSIVYWMRTSASTAGNRVIVARDDASNSLHWWVGCDNSGRERFQLRDVNGNGVYIGNKGALLNDGDWHFIVAVRDNSVDMNRIYVDGVKIDSAYHDYTAGFHGTAELNIGYIDLGGRYRYDGDLDEAATFDKALTDAEILVHYNNGLIGKGYCEEEPAPPVIVSIPDTLGFVGWLYTYDVDATGIPAPTYALLTYPAGMTIDPVTGEIEWTPSAAGDYAVEVEASNDEGTDTQSYTIHVSEPPPCPIDMISYWKLDETGGTTYADFFGGNDASASPAPPTPSTGGIVGGCQVLNGTNNYMTAPDNGSFDWSSTSSFSIECWCRFTVIGGKNKVMVARDQGGGSPHWWLGARSSDGVALFNLLDTSVNGVACEGAVALNDDVWHHLVAVRDEGVDMNRLYVDGVKVDSASYDYGAGFEAATQLDIGYMAYNGTPDYFYNGKLDEMAIYDRPLTDAEILMHYTKGLAGFGYCTSDLVATLLHSYNARLRDYCVTIEWRLTEAGADMRFFVLRAAGGTSAFAEIAREGIMRDGLSFSFMDANCEPGGTYAYRVDVEDGDGRRTLFETDEVSVPVMPLTLYQNYPNPFNPSTVIRFVVPEKCRVKLSIFDAQGRHVANLLDQVMTGGFKETAWDGRAHDGRIAASGVYFYRLKAGSEVLTKKMLLLR